MAKSDPALLVVERTQIRRKLKDLYYQQENEVNVHHQASVRIDKEIAKLKQRLAEIDPSSIDIDRPYKPRNHSGKPVEHCVNPKCLKRIETGQPAVKYGFWGLCCNFKCLAEAMRSN